MKKYKQYNIPDPMFRSNLSLFIGDLKEITKHLKKIGIKDESLDSLEEVNGRFIREESYSIIIICDYDESTLLHELIHHVFSTLDRKGAEISVNNDETFAYYYEMMYNNIKEALKRNVKNNNKRKDTVKKK